MMVLVYRFEHHQSLHRTYHFTYHYTTLSRESIIGITTMSSNKKNQIGSSYPVSYPVGTRIYKEFPSYGWFWGTITSITSCNDDTTTDSGTGNCTGKEQRYYDILYTDGDSETLDQNEIEQYVLYAIEKESNDKKKNSSPPPPVASTKRTKRITGTNSATDTSHVDASDIDNDSADNETDEASSEDSEFQEELDDDDDDDESDEEVDCESSDASWNGTSTRKRISASRKRQPTRNAVVNTSSRKRRICIDDESVDDDDHGDDDDNITPSPTRISPSRKCKQQQQHDLDTFTNVIKESSTTIDEGGRTKKRKIENYFQKRDGKNNENVNNSNRSTMNNTKTTALLKFPKESSVQTSSKKSKASNNIPPPVPIKKKLQSSNRKSISRQPSNASGTGTSSVGIYDKKPYSGGKDLEVISDIQHMFDDMITNKILSDEHSTKLLCNLMEKLQQCPLRIATMCSGTESPILALDMIQNAIHDAAVNLKNIHVGTNTKNDHIQRLEKLISSISSTSSERLFPVEHIFSCEIEPYKQAYIERNFHPPLLFRDIRELGNDHAYTAYGAYVPVPNTPNCVDILIAGTSCVDYSNLNNQKVHLILCTAFFSYC
jgi:hypothetical protein